MQPAISTPYTRFLFMLTTFLLLGLAAPAWPFTSPESLKGISAIQVIVQPLDPEAERDGLTQDQLQAGVEVRLRKAGIRVLSTREPRTPCLSLNVNTLKDRSGLYTFSIHLEFMRGVPLDRHHSVVTLAPTWSVGDIDTVDERLLRESERSRVDDAVDQFINAYLEQNPRP
jgi:hypothetical protein